MFFKRKRKEKAKRGNLLRKVLLVALILVVLLLGVVLYPLQQDKAPEIAFAGSESVLSVSGNMANACSYSQGFGIRVNSVAANQIETALQAAQLPVREVAVEDKMIEYKTCGDVSTPLYRDCSTLTIALPIESTDPSESELGSHIADILDVLTVDSPCTPELLTVTFENPRGNITWQMEYKLALVAYLNGARGVELYDPTARR